MEGRTRSLSICRLVIGEKEESFFGLLSEAGDESGSGVKNNAENDNRDNMRTMDDVKIIKNARTYARSLFK